MTQLATVQSGLPQSREMSIQEISQVAKSVAASRLFPGIENEQAAFTLMMLCQAEGLHPMAAMRRYHIIQGRPSMRADAMQAEYQRQGGVIRWGTSDAQLCEATFFHPVHAPDPGVRISMSFAEAQNAGLTGNPTWKKFPAAMLRARVISQGVRMVLPGVVVGIYSDAEVEDMVYQDRHDQVVEVAAGGPPVDVETSPPAGPRKTDERTFREFVIDATSHCNRTLQTEAHAAGVELGSKDLARVEDLERRLHAWAANQGLRTKGEAKAEMSVAKREAILTELYASYGKPMRAEIVRLVEIFATNGRKRVEELRGKGDAYEPEDMTLEEAMS